MEQPGFYCSTSGTYFDNKATLTEHYKSEFHRYNLKRKVAGLPPVTREWFEARRAQLVANAAPAANRIWICPLSKKKFHTEARWHDWTRSKKFKDLVKKSGAAPPEPVVREVAPPDQAREQSDAQPATPQGDSGPVGATIRHPVKMGGVDAPNYRPRAAPADAAMQSDSQESDDDDDDEDDGSSGWETASESEVRDFMARQARGDDAEDGSEDEAGEGGVGPDSINGQPLDASQWEQWDASRCLFCSNLAGNFGHNLEHMYKKHGFYIPDAEFCADPEGLIQYLGLKVSVGLQPLMSRGDDPETRTFRSLHAVQRHMADTNACRMLYEGNEEEYETWYDYDSPQRQTDADGPADTALALRDSGADVDIVTGGYEIMIKGDGGRAGKVLGSRDLLLYYRQRARRREDREGVQSAALVQRYRALALPTATTPAEQVAKFAQRQKLARAGRHNAITDRRGNANRNLPKNVTY